MILSGTSSHCEAVARESAPTGPSTASGPPLAWDQNRTAEPPVTQVGKGVAVAYPHADIAKAKRIC